MKPFVTVLLGITVAVLLAPGLVRAGEPEFTQHESSAVARARAAFLKHMSSHRPLVHSIATPLAAAGGASSAPSVNWSGFADVEGGSKTVSSVSGQWTIPNVQCPGGLY